MHCLTAMFVLITITNNISCYQILWFEPVHIGFYALYTQKRKQKFDWLFSKQVNKWYAAIGHVSQQIICKIFEFCESPQIRQVTDLL